MKRSRAGYYLHCATHGAFWLTVLLGCLLFWRWVIKLLIRILGDD